MGPLEGGEAANGVRYVQFTAPRFNFLIQDGRYNIRVFGLNGQQVGRYRLTISVDRENILCTPDVASQMMMGQARLTSWERKGFPSLGLMALPSSTKGWTYASMA